MTKLIYFLFITTFFLLIFSCTPFSENTLKRIKREGIIRVGYANDIPYGYSTAQGEITGEAPEIAKVILAKMGVNKINGILIEFGSLIPALKAGRIDIIAAGMFITPARCKDIAFSEPTYRIGQAFLVKKGNPKKLHSYEDVKNNKNAVLCVLKGAVEGEYALALGISAARILEVPDTSTSLKSIIQGEADALALTSLSIENLISNTDSSEIERAFPFENPVINNKPVFGYGAFGFRKEDKKLLKEFNKHLAAFIGTTEHINLVKPFGFTDLPGNISACDICK